MQYKTITTSLSQISTGALIIPVKANNTISAEAGRFDKSLKGLLKNHLQAKDLCEKNGSTLYLPAVKNKQALPILLIRVIQLNTLQDAELMVSHILGNLSARVKECTIVMEEINSTLSSAQVLRLTLQAFHARTYQFSAYKSNVEKKLLENVTFWTEDKKALATSLPLLEGMTVAKNLANTPCNICTPEYMAAEALKLGSSEKKLSVKIYDEKAIKALKMGAFLGVAQGSKNPPRFIEIRYAGGKAKDNPTVLIGKGITFDTGGISLKPGAGMEDMKYDMSGGATVIGLLFAAAKAKLPLNLVGLIPCAENMPDGNAYRPGDVLTSRSGKTIEITNTDAEGRLILCDVLTYAKETFKPRMLIDIATLTGAMVVAMGSIYQGVFSRSKALFTPFEKAAEESLDKTWNFPIDEDYQKEMDSKIADMKNAATSRYAGAITAACFLSRFVDKEQDWVHMDIAGTAYHGGNSVGATGRPLPLLYRYLENLCQA